VRSTSVTLTLTFCALLQPAEDERAKQSRLQLKCIEEIISTEKEYVKDLQTIVDIFLGQIRTSKLLADTDINAIFR
jgi:hypothetical protein